MGEPHLHLMLDSSDFCWPPSFGSVNLPLYGWVVHCEPNGFFPLSGTLDAMAPVRRDLNVVTRTHFDDFRFTFE